MTLATHSYMLALRVGVSNDNERRIGGLAVPYNLTASTKDGLERVAPDAFRQVLAATRDILLLADHQPDRLLARRASGNLTLTDSAPGCRIRRLAAPRVAAQRRTVPRRALLRSTRATALILTYALLHHAQHRSNAGISC